MTGTCGLYDPSYERDSCGVGMAVDSKGGRSHGIVEYGLRILENMAHRGAENGDGRSGDGAGIMVQIPHRFFRRIGIPVPEAGRYGTGLVFLPRDAELADRCIASIRRHAEEDAMTVVALRDVPVDSTVPGPMALAGEPRIVQPFISSFDSPETLERKLFRLRKIVSNEISSWTDEGAEDFYICSLSSRCMVYKGMLTPAQLRAYYPDLEEPDFESGIALVHSRFSTNTLPAWKLAQPFRMLAHNGEINTIRANRANMEGRESRLSTPMIPDTERIFPVVQPGMSDSASLDNVFEFLCMAGRDAPSALSVLVPESWNDRNPIPDSLKAYYEFHSIAMEPWDGPAAIMFTDGRYAGGTLDRNGLRPARYTVYENGLVIMASEAGVVPDVGSRVAETGRLKPGKMMMIDTLEGRIVRDPEIKMRLADAYPYRDWLERNRVDLSSLKSGRRVERSVSDCDARLREFGYTAEDLAHVFVPMAGSGAEATGSAGCDIPIAVLSDRPQRLFNYFRQQFAQVTNPPIDPIREDLVMSVTGYIGSMDKGLLETRPDLCKAVKIRHPVITDREIDLLRNLRYLGFSATDIDITFPAEEGAAGLRSALDRIRAEAERAADAGVSYIVLTDRGSDERNAPIPSVLALSAVDRHLVSVKKRMQTAIVVESGEPRETMHFALLIGYGANAVCPYMSFAIIERMCREGRLKLDADTAEANYLRAVDKGLKKIMSKMGIATIRSYRGSRLFEMLGVSEEVGREFFGDTSTPVGGIGLAEIAESAAASHRDAYLGDGDALSLDPGVYTFRKDGERHAWSPATVKLLRAAAHEGDAGAYREFAEKEDGEILFLRSLLGFESCDPVPLDSVEPAESIMRRMEVGGISFGAISKEAHECLAEAMNDLGSRSNTGEGGEDPARFSPSGGRNTRSAVKQIASGRFGVTAEYLVNADVLQIKVAQGAKPGEGGQLLGFKVDEVIARTRHTLPGITLISPPPHHDIYSIEDLKQLIYDLKCINPSALVSVKLVAESGVGTVAAGVAKAGADMIVISSGDGGTGASPLSSIRYAGSSWEVGLAEVQQTLVLNGLRDRVSIQVDGQLKTGRDIVVAALLGAESFAFATAPMVAMGCVMCRRCQTNTCPVGIATQDPERRRRFDSSPADVERYWRFMAEDVRSRLASLGLRSLGEAVGRADLLCARDDVPLRGLDFTRMLSVLGEVRSWSGERNGTADDCIDAGYRESVARAVASGGRFSAEMPIANVQRSAGAMISGDLARSKKVLEDGAVDIRFKGAAGQSFGAFLVKGMRFTLEGIANDYVGKGLSGGTVVVRPPADAPSGGAIAGNTVLYGATSGELYIAGSVGERFCVRNSGAVAVAEGAGDHCCEYMTGGRAVILGPVGRNFAAGMSAGIAYVYDEAGDFDRHCNMDMVEIDLVEDPADVAELRSIIERHRDLTGSAVAEGILEDWGDSAPRFRKVMPIGYKELLAVSRGVDDGPMTL